MPREFYQFIRSDGTRGMADNKKHVAPGSVAVIREDGSGITVVRFGDEKKTKSLAMKCHQETQDLDKDDSLGIKTNIKGVPKEFALPVPVMFGCCPLEWTNWREHWEYYVSLSRTFLQSSHNHNDACFEFVSVIRLLMMAYHYESDADDCAIPIHLFDVGDCEDFDLTAIGLMRGLLADPEFSKGRDYEPCVILSEIFLDQSRKHTTYHVSSGCIDRSTKRLYVCDPPNGVYPDTTVSPHLAKTHFTTDNNVNGGSLDASIYPLDGFYKRVLRVISLRTDSGKPSLYYDATNIEPGDLSRLPQLVTPKQYQEHHEAVHVTGTILWKTLIPPSYQTLTTGLTSQAIASIQKFVKNYKNKNEHFTVFIHDWKAQTGHFDTDTSLKVPGFGNTHFTIRVVPTAMSTSGRFTKFVGGSDSKPRASTKKPKSPRPKKETRGKQTLEAEMKGKAEKLEKKAKAKVTKEAQKLDKKLEKPRNEARRAMSKAKSMGKLMEEVSPELLVVAGKQTRSGRKKSPEKKESRPKNVKGKALSSPKKTKPPKASPKPVTAQSTPKSKKASPKPVTAQSTPKSKKASPKPKPNPRTTKKKMKTPEPPAVEEKKVTLTTKEMSSRKKQTSAKKQSTKPAKKKAAQEQVVLDWDVKPVSKKASSPKKPRQHQQRKPRTTSGKAQSSQSQYPKFVLTSESPEIKYGIYSNVSKRS